MTFRSRRTAAWPTVPGLLNHNGAVPYALPERADFEDNPLGDYAFRVEWLSLVLLREPVNMVSGRLARDMLAHDAADGGIMTQVVPVHNKDLDARVGAHVPVLEPVTFRVDEQVIIVRVDPHERGHGKTIGQKGSEACEVGFARQCGYLFIQCTHAYHLRSFPLSAAGFRGRDSGGGGQPAAGGSGATTAGGRSAPPGAGSPSVRVRPSPIRAASRGPRADRERWGYGVPNLGRWLRCRRVLPVLTLELSGRRLPEGGI